MSDRVPDVSLRQLAYFVAVSRAATLSEAADELRVSDSALSSAMTALESAVGLRLMLRTRAQGVQLTAAGREFARRAAGLVADANDLASLRGRALGEVSGELRIAATEGLAPVVLARLARAVARAHPALELEVSIDRAGAVLSRVERGDLDCGILGLRRTPELPHLELFRSGVHVLLPAEHRLAGAEAIDLTELASEPYILLDTQPSVENSFALFGAAGIRPAIRHRTSSFELVRSLVGQGLGFSLQAIRPWGDRAYDGSALAVVPLAPPLDGSFTVQLVRSTASARSPQLDALWETARRVFRAEAGGEEEERGPGDRSEAPNL